MTETMDSLQNYMRQIQGFEPLSFDDEQTYARAWLNNKDEEAFQKLMSSYLRLVVKVAMSFRGYGLPVNEMIQEGNIGLMQAIARFDPDKGFRLSTYAMWWIRASIQEYILNNWSLIKIGTTSTQKKLFINLRRLKNQLRELDDEHLGPEAVSIIAKELGVKEADVVNMDQRLTHHDSSLNSMVGADSDTEWNDWLIEDRPNQEEIYSNVEETRQRRIMLQDALDILDDRERAIFIARRLNESDEVPTLEELSGQMGISRERVRQLEVRAFDKVKKHMQQAA